MTYSKKSLREKFLKKRVNMDRATFIDADKIICSRLKRTRRIEAANTIVGFYPIEGEPNIIPFLEWCLENNKKLFLPRIKKYRLEIVEVGELTRLSRGVFDIYEPSSDIEHYPRLLFDCILVPGVVFDSLGNRLGFGKGYYDRFLTKSVGFKIGICYGFQIIDSVPVEPHDQAVDEIISDKI